MEITEVREISTYAPAPTPFVTSAQRFGDTAETETAPGTGMPPEDLFSFATPEGWSVAPAASGPMAGMRLVDMRFGPNGEGECFLSMMPGAAGGFEANLNRWRGQMGLPAYTAEELAALPKREMFGQEATYVDFEGTFTNVGAAAPLEGYRMIGLIQQTPKFTLFVKMTGPKALVEANQEAFMEFAQSIGLKR
ncbi:hypothetical protein FEM03_13230 [Phragmitibacter flavus]|uniref:DUF1795 domain-containing protein n=1 Tax=Phragmitibacter flavus TaxID=2576071 RepID=A0A5R8KCX5_9BACT|nr:hypothetical protein [Phragmitibacter flavus]TLD70151.1 hypothetical protein FEM03_13230 [Phragmitibacter flavus]